MQSSLENGFLNVKQTTIKIHRIWKFQNLEITIINIKISCPIFSLDIYKAVLATKIWHDPICRRNEKYHSRISMWHLLWPIPCFVDWMNIIMILSTHMVKSSTITHIIVTHRLQRKEEKGAENTWTSIHIENCFNMYIWILKFICASHNIAKPHLQLILGKRIIRPRARNKHAMIFQ